MISTIKTWALAGLALAASIAYALFRTEQAKRAKERLEAVKQARETEKKATKAMIEGLGKEEAARHADIDTDNRTHFSD